MQTDYSKGEKITLYCLAGNILLSIFKGIVGFIGGSKAMVADALHSGSDVIATLVVYLCLKIAKKPADDCHMYGHGKIEAIAASSVALILIITAFFIVMSIIKSLISQEFIAPYPVALAAAVISIVIKEIMFRVTYNIGKKINSESIIANAWDHRADAYSSIGTFFGILGSIMGGYYGIEWLKYFDPLAGILVAGLILKIAVDILLKAIRNLMDASPEAEKIARINEIAEGVEGVQAISWTKGRYIGRHIIVDMAVEIDAEKSVHEGHEITLSIKEVVMESVQEVGDVLIHINPGRLKQ
ncbi:MAG: cation diffusion facilitator family transporter [Bacillota bacterium]|nr:cation diffusion facilitator family transporter [Bacillota bacterium]